MLVFSAMGDAVWIFIEISKEYPAPSSGYPEDGGSYFLRKTFVNICQIK
jgi:hypothetical protein